MAILTINTIDVLGENVSLPVSITLCDIYKNTVTGYVTTSVLAASYGGSTNSSGYLAVDLIPNAEITSPLNTVYLVDVGGHEYLIIKSGDPQTLFEALAATPTDLTAGVVLVGATGPQGTLVRYGTVNPTIGIGNNGDFYINTATSFLFGPKAGGVWPTGVSLIGPIGLTGPQGFQGVVGAQGVQGFTGSVGPQGTQGVVGATGATGAAGSQGFQGFQGFSGPQGSTGIDGRTVLSGVSAPSSALGANGDFFIDTTAYALYGPKTAGSWGSPVSLIGPTGSMGPTGVQGFQGFQGPQGFQGVFGNTGTTGAGGTLGYYGAFSDYTTQTPVANTATPILLGTTDEANGVSIASGSRITFANAGTYNIQWSAQFVNTDTSDADISVWFRKNGVDIPGSTGVVNVPSKHGSDNGHALPSWNFVTTVAAGDYFQFYWSSPLVTVAITTFPVSGSPTRPTTASVVVTATQVMYTQLGPQGVQGVQGPQGFQGFQGTQGVQGVQGFQGNQGFQGSTTVGTAIDITAPTTTTVPLVIRGGTGHTADLVRIVNRDGLLVAYIDDTVGQARVVASNGSFTSALLVDGNGPRFAFGVPGSMGAFGECGAFGGAIMFKGLARPVRVERTDDATVFMVRGISTQTNNLQEWQNSSGTSLASMSAGGTLSARIAQRVTTITSSATPTINTDACDAVTITALATAITSMTSSLTGTPSNFDRLTFRIKDNATAQAITWGSKFVQGGVALPTTTVVSKVLTVGFIYDTVKAAWSCVAVAQEA